MKARGFWDLGSGAPFSICAWEVYLKCAAPSAASGASYSFPLPPSPPPGLRLATLGTGSDRSAVG